MHSFSYNTHENFGIILIISERPSVRLSFPLDLSECIRQKANGTTLARFLQKIMHIISKKKLFKK